MDTLEIILSSTVVAALVSGLIGLWRDRKFEKLKHNLRTLAFEHEVKFTALHEKRAEAITEIYQLLISVKVKAERAQTPTPRFVGSDDEPVPDTRGDESYQAYLDLKEFYLKNRLYFTPSQCNKLDEITKQIGTLSASTYPHQQIISDEGLRELVKKRAKIAKEAIPPLLADLEGEFRKMLGIKLEV